MHTNTHTRAHTHTHTASGLVNGQWLNVGCFDLWSLSVARLGSAHWPLCSVVQNRPSPRHHEHKGCFGGNMEMCRCQTHKSAFKEKFVGSFTAQTVRIVWAFASRLMSSAIIAGSSSSSVQCGGQYRSVRVTHMHINLVAACSIFVIWVVHCFPQNGCLLVGGGRYFTTWKWHRDAQKSTIFTAKVKYMRGKHCKFTLNSYFHPFIATASSTQQSQYVSALCSNPGTWSKWRHIHWKAVDHRVQLFSFCLNCQHTNSWASIWLSMIFEQS